MSAFYRWLSDFARDVRYAVRGFRRNPTFALVAIATLALTLGANTAMFSVAHKLLIARLPVREPEQLVLLSRSSLEQTGDTRFAYLFFRELEAARDVFDDVLCRAAGSERVTVGVDAGGAPAMGELVSGSYFEMLGVTPHLGRLFTRVDDVTPGAHPVLVLSYRYWQRQFAGDASVIGRTLRITGVPMTVIGVTPPEFDGLDPGQSVDLRVPVSMVAEVRGGPRDPRLAAVPSSLNDPRAAEMIVVGRLRRGVTIAQAEQVLSDRYRRFVDNVSPPSTLHLESAASGIGMARARYYTSMRALMGITSAVLLIACLNLANLLIARASERTHEFAVRVSVGAGTAHLVRQLLTEGAVLSIAGAVAGLAVVYPAARLLIQLITPAGSPQVISVDPPVSAFVFHGVTTVLTTVLFGAAPALAQSRPGLARVVRARSSVASSRVARRVFLSLQVAFSIVVLVGAVLFVRTVHALRATDLGFRADRLLVLALSPQNAGRAVDRTLPFFRAVRERVMLLPGVTGATYGQVRPLANASWRTDVVLTGCCSQAPSAAFRNVVGPAYFATMGIAMVAGRDFKEADAATAPKVAIVNETFARTFGAGRDLLGARIGVSIPEYTIVGIVADAKYAHVREPIPPVWFVPYEQQPNAKYLDLYVRTSGDPATITESVRAAIAAVDPEVALFEVRTLQAQVDNLLIVEQTVATRAALFAAIGAGLAGLGVYGIVVFVVTSERRAIAIRMALGARPAVIIRQITTDAWTALAIGAVAGIAMAAALTRYASSLLYGVTRVDAATGIVVVLLMAVFVTAAASLPSLRATRIDPTKALREG
jgi:predicted permease